MKKAIMKKWVAALRSGEFKQARGALESHDGRNCCLGVLCNLALIEGICDYTPGGYFGDRHNMLPAEVCQWAGMKTISGDLPGGKPLWVLNDTEGFSFERIADVIEKNWQKL